MADLSPLRWRMIEDVTVCSLSPAELDLFRPEARRDGSSPTPAVTRHD